MFENVITTKSNRMALYLGSTAGEVAKLFQEVLDKHCDVWPSISIEKLSCCAIWHILFVLLLPHWSISLAEFDSLFVYFLCGIDGSDWPEFEQYILRRDEKTLPLLSLKKHKSWESLSLLYSVCSILVCSKKCSCNVYLRKIKKVSES